MKPVLVLILAALLTVCVGVVSAGQPQGQAPPQPAQQAMGTPIPAGAVVMIYRCEVKPGHGVAQQKAAAATSRAAAKLPMNIGILAMNAVTGPSEVWFMIPYNSLAEVDKVNEAISKAPATVQTDWERINDVEGEHYSTMRGMLVMYEEDMSLGASFNVSPYRAMIVTTYRVREGHAREFAEMARKVIAAYKKADIGMRIAGFEVLAGAPSGTYMFFRPMKTTSEFLPTDAARKAFVDAFGGQDAMMQLDKMAADVIMTSEDALFTFSPKMSNVPASYASADPFWRVTAPAVAKAGNQKKAVQPAGVKK